MFDADALIALRRLNSLAVAPDGTWAAVGVQRLNADKTKYISDLVRLDLTSHESYSLTTGDTNDHSPAFLTDGRLAFLSMRGDEDSKKQAQIYAFRPTGGEPEAITDEPLGVSSFVAATDADTIVCLCSVLPNIPHDEQRAHLKDRREKGPSALVYDETPVRYWDHWLPQTRTHVVAFIGGVRHDLTPEAGREIEQTSLSASPDGRYVIWTSRRKHQDSVHDHSFVLYDLKTKTQTVLFDEATLNVSNACWAPDSKRFAFVRHHRITGTQGNNQLCVHDVDGQATKTLATEFDLWFTPVTWAGKSRLVASAEADTSVAVFVVNVDSDTVERITAAEAGGAHRSLNVSNGRVFGLRARISHPPEPFVCDLAINSEPKLLARMSGFEMPSDIKVEDHRVVSTDGEPIQYFTVSKSSETPRPALMWIHGGPVGQWGDDWHWRWNSVVGAEKDWLMVMPNPRGSTGFGQEFVEGIFGNTWGAQCYEDLTCVADDIQARDDVDAGKFSAMGGSFGGYMTNWIGTQTSRFHRLVTHAGLFDLAMFHGVTDMPPWWAHVFNINPYTGRKDFDVYSPVAHVSHWKTPTLVVHGDLDYRVPVGEALALFEALQFHGVPSKLLIFPDENHWILKPRNILSWYAETLGFIEN
jgi:dipeptidyl aminopeptidase/acylaminoacyl peptidase